MELKNNIGGLDLSLSSTGIVIVDSDGDMLYSASLKTKKLKGMQRLKFIKDHVLKVFTEFNVKQSCIESYAFGVRQSRSKFNLGELGGVIRLALYENGIEYVDIAPPTLKKYVTGFGNADKIMMVEAVLKRWSIDFGSDNDKADALGLAKLGVEKYINEKEISKIIKQMQKDNVTYL
jgi:crossover junction endodeoxyribonuclease RuvC